jgi:hypothetical protein
MWVKACVRTCAYIVLDAKVCRPLHATVVLEDLIEVVRVLELLQAGLLERGDNMSVAHSP